MVRCRALTLHLALALLDGSDGGDDEIPFAIPVAFVMLAVEVGSPPTYL